MFCFQVTGLGGWNCSEREGKKVFLYGVHRTGQLERKSAPLAECKFRRLDVAKSSSDDLDLEMSLKILPISICMIYYVVI